MSANLPTVADARTGTSSFGSLVCSVLASILALAIGLVAFKLQPRDNSCDSERSIQLSGSSRSASRIFSTSSNRILKGQNGPDQPNVLNRDGVVGSVSRSNLPSLATRIDVTVPQIIWQTARSRENTPELGTDLFNSWTTQNPGWDHYFMDDEDVEAFVAAHYNETVLQTFKDLPLGVMRADVFRYMLIHLYGGVYTDMDTECFQPAQRWTPSGCQFAVFLEDNDMFFCQWSFAAVPGHGALGSVLDLVLHKMINREHEKLTSDDEHFVHFLTGPAIFTEGILDYLGADRERHSNLSVLYSERGEELRQKGVCLLQNHEMFGMLMNHNAHVKPELLGGSWRSWTEEREEFLARLGKDGGKQGGRDVEEHGGRDEERPDKDAPEEGQREEEHSEQEQAEEEQSGEGQREEEQ